MEPRKADVVAIPYFQFLRDECGCDDRDDPKDREVRKQIEQC
jgi:hypothetical protein